MRKRLRTKAPSCGARGARTHRNTVEEIQHHVDVTRDEVVHGDQMALSLIEQHPSVGNVLECLAHDY